MTLPRRLFGYVRPQLTWLLLAYACMVLLAITGAFFAFLAGPGLYCVFTGNLADLLRTHQGELRFVWSLIPPAWLAKLENLQGISTIWVVPMLLLVTALLKGFAQTGQFFLLGQTSQRILQALRCDAFAALLRQSPAFYTRRAHGDLLSRLTHDANLIEQAFFYGCGPILRDALAVLFLLGLCFKTDQQLSLWTLLILPIAIVPLTRFSGWLKRVSKQGQAAMGAIGSLCYESLAGIKVVQAFGNEAQHMKQMQTIGNNYYQQMLMSYFIRAVRTPTMETLGYSGLAGLIALLGYQVQARGADPAHYVSFFTAIIMMYDPLKKLGGVSDYLAAGLSAAERLFELIDHPVAIGNLPSAKILPPFEQAVVFDNVGFSYDTTTVLKNIVLNVPRGHVVALVGPSGGGKTTMANLLLRFYDVTSGAVRIDGYDIRDIKLETLRAQIGWVSQDTFLFNASVFDNIAYGYPGATQAAVQRAAKAAYADEFIDRLPQGYQTVIGERGVLLSGGQKQRLAIARVMLRDAPLVILDEATSNLDVESEQFVQAAFVQLMHHRTSLVIAHRLSTIHHADTIAVLKNGHIVEQGHHQNLLAENGEYARLYHMQFKEAPNHQRNISPEAIL